MYVVVVLCVCSGAIYYVVVGIFVRSGENMCM